MLTRSDNHLLKGFAILSIMLHNLMHMLPGAVAENEFTYSGRNILRLVYEFRHSDDIWRMVWAVISHFGHYGVPIFLFLSGYGLVMKYEKSGATVPSALRFIGQHMQKLWSLMIPGFVVAVLFMVDWQSWWAGHPDFSLNWGDSNPWLTLTFLANFRHFSDLVYGPWWFFSLMLQFYVIYRCLLYRWRSAWLLWCVVGASLLLMWWANFSGIRVEISQSSLLHYINVSALGHLLPFALGITAARWAEVGKWAQWRRALSPVQKNYRDLLTSLFGFFLLYLSAFDFTLWLISPLFAIMTVLPWAKLLKSPTWRVGWEHIGVLSSALFVYHPIIRGELLPQAEQAVSSNDPMRLMMLLLIFVTLSYILARVDFGLRQRWKQWRKQ